MWCNHCPGLDHPLCIGLPVCIPAGSPACRLVSYSAFSMQLQFFLWGSDLSLLLYSTLVVYSEPCGKLQTMNCELHDTVTALYVLQPHLSQNSSLTFYVLDMTTYFWFSKYATSRQSLWACKTYSPVWNIRHQPHPLHISLPSFSGWLARPIISPPVPRQANCLLPCASTVWSTKYTLL